LHEKKGGVDSANGEDPVASLGIDLLSMLDDR